jgi:ComF family protein
LCIKQKPYFDKAYIDYEYTEPLRSLLHQFKYANALYLAGFFSQLMFNSIHKMTPKPQCLIPVPMHPKRLKSRGFNQAVVLSKLLAKSLHIPYNLNCCKKIKNTSAQASLSQEERRKNLKSAFSVASLDYQHVLIVDDLLTTGSTVNEIAFLLKQCGVQRVDVCCPARAVREG